MPAWDFTLVTSVFTSEKLVSVAWDLCMYRPTCHCAAYHLFNTVQCRYKNRSFRISPITLLKHNCHRLKCPLNMLKSKKVEHFFGRSYLRLASINQVNKRLFCIHRTLCSFVKKSSKMLLAFFHLGVDIDLIDCLVEKK